MQGVWRAQFPKADRIHQEIILYNYYSYMYVASYVVTICSMSRKDIKDKFVGKVKPLEYSYLLVVYNTNFFIITKRDS